MRGDELIINFEGDKAYLSDNKVLSLKQLGLPEIAKEFKKPAAWGIKVISHQADKKRIFAEIKTYNEHKLPFSTHQMNLSLLNDIERIDFKHIDTGGLLLTLGAERVKRTEPSLMKHVPIKEALRAKSILLTVKANYSIPIKNIRFQYGCIAFDKWISDVNREVEITIANDDIRAEFDAIRNYFANVLQTKKIRVAVAIQFADGEISSIKATSPEIAKINKDLIESVKFEFVKGLIKKNTKIEIDKSLFTMDEYFDTLTDKEVKANIFYNQDGDLLEDLLQISGTKHYKHLRFLSSKHAHTIMKLRFVLKPFSFIFLIEGERNYHIIWETLDTEEATYIWHSEKDSNKLKLTLEKIENIINVIKVQKKKAYLNSREDNFKRVFHDYSELVDGFVKWKGELESVLT